MTDAEGMLEALAEPHRGLVRGLLQPLDPTRTAGRPSPTVPAGLEGLLSVLAEPRRQELVRLLEHEQLTQRQLVGRLGLSQPLLSHHLKVLREAGLVEKTVCDRRPRLPAAGGPASGRRCATAAERGRHGASTPC